MLKGCGPAKQARVPSCRLECFVNKKHHPALIMEPVIGLKRKPFSLGEISREAALARGLRPDASDIPWH